MADANRLRAMQMLARLKCAEDAGRMYPEEKDVFYTLAIYKPDVDMEEVLEFRRQMSENIGIYAGSALWAMFDKNHLARQAACANTAWARAGDASAASVSAVLNMFQNEPTE